MVNVTDFLVEMNNEKQGGEAIANPPLQSSQPGAAESVPCQTLAEFHVGNDSARLSTSHSLGAIPKQRSNKPLPQSRHQPQQQCKSAQCYFYVYKENIHHHLGEVKFILGESNTTSEVFEGHKFDLGNGIKDKNADVAADLLMKREYNGLIT